MIRGRKSVGIARVYTGIYLERIQREFIWDILGREYTDYIASLINAEMEVFMGDNHDSPRIKEFKARAKGEMEKIQKARSDASMCSGNNPRPVKPTADQEDEAIRAYLKTLAPFQLDRLKRICIAGDTEKLRPFEEKAEEITRVWIRPAIFFRMFPPDVEAVE